MRNIIINLVIGAIIFTGGCLKNPFASRHSETPAGTTGTWETPAAPEMVIQNIFYAYNEKVLQNYQSCLAENYIFSAPEDSIRAEGRGSGYLYYGWDKNADVLTAQNMFSIFGSPGRHLDLNMVESASNPDSIGDTVAVLYREYTMRIVVADSIGSDTAIAKGLATFWLSQAQFDLWSIYFWRDLPDTGADYGWGELKAMYRQ